MLKSPKYIVIAALLCEAKPLISHWKLKKDTTVTSFCVYHNEDTLLVLSGVGSLQACMATTFSHSLIENPSKALWINLGIAGHGKEALGELVFCHRISHEHQKKVFYPHIPPTLHLPSYPLLTLDKPSSSFKDDQLHDMEAYGFFLSCQHLASPHHAIVLKVVSDNPENNYQHLNHEKVTALIEGAFSSIEKSICAYAASLSFQHFEKDPLKTIKRYTHSEKLILKKLWKKVLLLDPKAPFPSFDLPFEQQKSQLENWHLALTKELL